MDNFAMLALLAGAVFITAVSRKLGASAPLPVTIVAAAVSFIPGIPTFTIDPALILTLVLPPLLYSSSLNVSVISFRRNLGNITMLGVVLVVVTALAVGSVAYLLIPDMTLPAALLLGAIVAPPDAVSATAVGRKLGLPRRLMTVLLGESLINDGTSLTLFKVFLTIVGGTALTFSQDLGYFALAVGVGVALGLVLGWVFTWGRQYLKDPVIESIMSVLLPFFAYVLAEHLGGSGVLAVVTAGLYVGFHQPTVGYRARLQEEPLWRAIDVLLEGLVFALIGLQLHTIVNSLQAGHRDMGTLLLTTAAVLAVVIFIRPVFLFATTAISKIRLAISDRATRGSDASLLTRSIEIITPEDSQSRRVAMRTKNNMRKFSPARPLSWTETLILSWTGMRGVVTLAAAMSVPSVLGDNSPFPAHDTVLIISFAVTVGTLLLQGLTLPWLIRLLNVTDQGQADRDRIARRKIMASTLREATTFVKQREGSWRKKYGDATVDRALAAIEDRLARFERQIDLDDAQKAKALDRKRIAELRRQVIQTRRRILLRERDKGTVDEELMREILHNIDAEELTLDTSFPHQH